MTSSPSIPILYINLNHRLDRKEHIERELLPLATSVVFNQSPQRIPAIENKIDGAIGCAMSHILCLEMALHKNWEYVFVCEDDLLFVHSPAIIQQLDSWFLNPEKTQIEWDVLIVGGNSIPPYELIATSNQTPIGIRVVNCQTTTGYIVKQSYFSTLLDNFRQGVENRIRTNQPQYAIDIFWKQLQQRDRWIMPLPMMAVQSAGYSDIEKRNVNYQSFMLDLEKKWLFRK